MASKQEIREEILILKDTQASEDAKASAACALGNWATREASNPLAVEAEGGLPLLVQLLQEGGGEAQRNAAYALWALAKKGNELARKGNEQVTRALVACGGQEALEALARDPTYHWDEKRGTGPLEYAEMALEDLPELSHGLGRRHFQRQVMDLECGLDECQAAEQLGTWAARSDENRVSISRVHGGEALLALVVNGSDDAKWHAARALRNLANNQEAKENILKADGIAVLTRLAEHGKRKVKKAAREALHVLSMVDAQRNPAAVADAKPPEKEASPTAIPTGEGTRVAMFSARFDGGPVEMKFRQVFSILRDHKYDVLMVAADAGDSFGDLTTEYLHRLRSEQGTMLAVCTKHYGEKTASSYSSHKELKFALDYENDVTVLPLKVEDTYPPAPPCGPEHEFDKTKRAQGYIDMVFGPSVVYLDCRNKSETDIAAGIAKHLQKHRVTAERPD